MTQCKACFAEVIFVPSAKTGKPMILNAKPSKGVVPGHRLASTTEHAAAFIIDMDGICEHAVARVVNVYTDHHATCPAVDSFRRPGTR